MRFAALLTPCLLLAACAAAPEQERPANVARTSSTTPIVIAHRGASGYLPEHTSDSKAMAHAMGADFIEQDVVLTHDGVPIVLHDVELDTVTDVAQKFPARKRADGRYYAIDFDVAEIAQLNVHERTDPHSGKPVFPGRFSVRGVRFGIRLLDEEIALIAGLNATTGRTVGLYAEVKAPAWHRAQGQDVARAVLDSLNRAGLRMRTDPVWVQCFDPAELIRIRNELDSDLKLVQLVGENEWGDASVDFQQMRTPQGLARVAEYADAIGVWLPHVVNWKDGKPQFTSLVRDAHALKLKVHVYTLRRDQLPAGAADFAAVHAALLEAGVDGVFTDFPDQTRTFLRARE